MMRMGGTKAGELDRSAELFLQILEEQGPAYALYLLLDSGYERAELHEIAKRLLAKGKKV